VTSLLESIPNEWGAKFDTESGAATRTLTGPNEISFRAASHMALVLFTPQPGREVGLNSDRRIVTSAPVGSLEIVPAGADLFARWAVEKENLLVALDPRRLVRLAGMEFQKEDFELRPPAPGSVDQKGLLLANMIREEVQRGSAANEPCIDALITLFGTHLLRTYSNLGDRPRPRFSGGLPPKRWQDVQDYIRANLEGDLSVRRLAEIADLSPSHFLRAFRQTAGQPPHQYVLTQRLAAAERLVRDTDVPLAAVARSAGFSSNSHMTAAMRRLRGVTPTVLRNARRKA
jgi:AraC family transcriptional regulator